MQKDINSSQIEESVYTFALNATVEHYSESHPFPFLGNTPSNLQCLDFPDNEFVIGTLNVVELSTTVLCVYNPITNISSFLRINYRKKNLGASDQIVVSDCDCVKVKEIDSDIQCEVNLIFQTNCFKWNINNPVNLTYKITDCTINLYFNNDLDEDRYVYLNSDWTLEDSFKVNMSEDNCTPNLKNALDCSKTLWNPKLTYPCIDLDVISGGSKTPGKYNYQFAYSTSKGIPLTPFMSLTQGISIFNGNKDISDKGIKINISKDVNRSRYKYFTIASGVTIQGQTTYRVIGTYSVDNTEIYDTDNDSGMPITIQELVSERPYYKNSKLITTSNNILFKADLQEYEKFNLQPIFNKVKVKWAASVLKEGDYAKSQFSQSAVGFLRDEVYALGIELILDNGEQGAVFPLVNRQLTTLEKSSIEEGDCVGIETRYFEKYNTATIDYQNTNYEEVYQKQKCNIDTFCAYGDFGAWESTENYPNIPEVWGDLCGQPIRHFKFPDHKLISHFSNGNETDDRYIFPLGVLVQSDINTLLDEAVELQYITQEQRNRIKGWKLVRGDRRNNKTIVAKGLLYHVWSYKKQQPDYNFTQTCQADSDKYYYPNYPFDDLRPDPFLLKDNSLYKDDNPQFENYNDRLQTFTNEGKYTFHSPDTHFIEPNLGTYFKREGAIKGTAKGFFNIAEKQAEYKLLKEKHFKIIVNLSRWIVSKTSSPLQEEVQQLSSNIGGSVLGTLGSFVGLGNAGKALGGLLGSFIGNSFYQNNLMTSFLDLSYKSALSLSQYEKFINIFQNFAQYNQHHYQYQAIGNYNNFEFRANDIDIFKDIKVGEYVDQGKYTLPGNVQFNNFGRESSVYLQLESPYATPNTTLDNSRILISQNTNPIKDTVTTTERFTCQKFSVTRKANSGVIRASVWGILCQPLFLMTTTVDSLIFKFKFSSLQQDGDETYVELNTSDNLGGYVFNQWNGYREVIKVKRKDSTNGEINLLITEICVYIINTEDPVYRPSTRNPDNFNPITNEGILIPIFGSCFRSYYLRGAEDAESFFGGADNLDNQGIYGDQNLKINKVEDCGEYVEVNSYIIKRACECNKPTKTDIYSYYGSIKQFNKNQYGSIYDIRWLSLESCLSESNKIIFGGDTYLGRFSLKRKHHFFNNSTFELPNDFDINYSLHSNAAYPAYYFDLSPYKEDKFLTSLDLNFTPTSNVTDYFIRALLPIFKKSIFRPEEYLNKPKYNFDCNIEDINDPNYDSIKETENEMNFSAVKGIMYLFSYGVVYYIAESEINLDLRNWGHEVKEDFYPHRSDLDTWLQQKTVNPFEDNRYLYDRSYSKQSYEEFHYIYDTNFKGQRDCKTDRQNRIIYSGQSQEIDDSDYEDNYLNQKALDYYDFSKKDGKLISIDGIEGEMVLVRQENNSSVYRAYLEINTSGETALISNGAMFRSKPQQFTAPTLGYFGSQHKAISHTPFGHISVDAKRGHVFILDNNAKGLKEISNLGLKHWFKENLPFNIINYFPDAEIDNTFIGCGLLIAFDYRFNTVYITKKDYRPLNNSITYQDKSYKLNNQIISLTDPAYFEDKSWTVSFNLYTQQWQSFHSFIPDYYVEHIDHFDTGIKGSLWKHNVTNKDYQRYYGKLYPFIVETITKWDGVNHILNSVGFTAEVLHYFNDYDFVELKDKTFNKAIIYNANQNTGILNLHNIVNNLFLKVKYPIVKSKTETDILVDIKENYHKFNQFKDRIVNRNIPIWSNEPNNVNKNLNELAFSTKFTENIRDLQSRIRLIQDKEYKYHFIFKNIFLNDTISRRL